MKTRSESPKLITKKKPKEKLILETLRRELLTGVYPVHSKLPVQTKLSRRFRVGGGTVQRALDRLIREGFLQARRRHGTFVVGKPPHLKNYALVFHSEPSQTWSKYYVALTNAAVTIQQEEDRRMMLFYGVDRHPDTDDYQRLLNYIRAHRLGGIIFDNVPHNLQGTPLLDETDIPRVAFMSQGVVGNVLAIGFNDRAFREKAIAYLAEQGRKRVAVISMMSMSSDQETHLESLAAARGMKSFPHWRLPISYTAPEGATRCMQLLMQAPPDQRPDALIVTDDNLVEASLAGLVAAGVRVPQDLDVVVHCNFPCPPMTVLPVKRLGYDIRQALRLAIEAIDRSRRGESVPRFQSLIPVFDEELPRKVTDPELAAVGKEVAG